MTTTTTDAASRYDELKAQRAALQAQIDDIAKIAFRERAEEIFAAHPDLAEFGWHQYTPYFNDGDECVFSANTDFPDVRMNDEDEATDFSKPYASVNGKYQPVEPTTPREFAGVAVTGFLEKFDDDELRDMFGDHMRVTVKRSGVEVEEYEHE